MPASLRARPPRAPKVPLCLAIALVASACGSARARYASAPRAAAEGEAGLERSVFSRDPRGQLTEDRLQQILASRLELEVPARVGVLPVARAEDWRGPGPSYDRVPAAVAELADALRGGELFTLVTEMIPIPSGALGMEALREVAARYKLRYLLLYRENIDRDARANAWAWGYATFVGALFLPGDTLAARGHVEASLFDVKTGLLLFTIRRRVEAEKSANVWNTDLKLAELGRELAAGAAPGLAGDVRGALLRFRRAVRAENRAGDGPPGTPIPGAALPGAAAPESPPKGGPSPQPGSAGPSTDTPSPARAAANPA